MTETAAWRRSRGDARYWKHARGATALDRCLVMGIVNRTPDSFYDGGRMDLAASIDHAVGLVQDGADLLDVGAVKAGPGEPVGEEEEIRRTLPLVEALVRRVDVPVAVETSRPRVAGLALEVGAAIVNDVSGLSDPRLAERCADRGAGLILMHHGGQRRGRPRHPRYADVVADVIAGLRGLVRRAVDAGVEASCLVVDPGLDFGKTTYHSLELVRRMPEIVAMGHPVLVAPSRKDVVGETLGLEPAERLEGTLALVSMIVGAGASVVRVHDVREAVRVVRMTEAVMGRRAPAAPTRGLWD